MLTEVLTFFMPSDLHQRLQSVPEAARDYVAAETRYFSLCGEFVLKKISIALIFMFALIGMVLMVAFIGLAALFFLLKNGGFGLSTVEVLLIEGGLMALLCAGCAGISWGALKQASRVMGEYRMHWEK